MVPGASGVDFVELACERPIRTKPTKRILNRLVRGFAFVDQVLGAVFDVRL